MSARQHLILCNEGVSFGRESSPAKRIYPTDAMPIMALFFCECAIFIATFGVEMYIARVTAIFGRMGDDRLRQAVGMSA